MPRRVPDPRPRPRTTAAPPAAATRDRRPDLARSGRPDQVVISPCRGRRREVRPRPDPRVRADRRRLLVGTVRTRRRTGATRAGPRRPSRRVASRRVTTGAGNSAPAAPPRAHRTGGGHGTPATGTGCPSRTTRSSNPPPHPPRLLRLAHSSSGKPTALRGAGRARSTARAAPTADRPEPPDPAPDHAAGRRTHGGPVMTVPPRSSDTDPRAHPRERPAGSTGSATPRTRRLTRCPGTEPIPTVTRLARVGCRDRRGGEVFVLRAGSHPSRPRAAAVRGESPGPEGTPPRGRRDRRHPPDRAGRAAHRATQQPRRPERSARRAADVRGRWPPC